MDVFISRERADADLLDCAAYLAERIKSSDGHAEAMAEIVPRYLERGDVDLAAELANAIDDPFGRDKLLILVAEKCAEVDDDEYALQLAESIEDHGLASQAIERIALAKAAKGQADKAAQVAEQMEHPDFVYAGVAVNLAAAGDAAGAGDAIKKIEFPAAAAQAYQHIAAAEIQAGSADSAISHLDSARENAAEIEHSEEKVRALCDIAKLYNEAGRRDKAVETYGMARDLAELLGGLRDYFLVMSAVGFLSAGSEELCERTLDLVTDKTQMASALLAIARHRSQAGRQEEALEDLDEAYQIIRSQRDFETRDSRARNSTMSSIAVQFAGFGKFERAVEIAQENADPAETSKALNQIAQVMTTRGEDELARQALNAIEDDADRLFALIAMSDVRKQAGDNDAAISLLDEAATLAESVPQLTARSEVLNHLAARFAAQALEDKARESALASFEVISLIRHESAQAVSLASIGTVYESAGLELTDAEKQHMHRFASAIQW